MTVKKYSVEQIIAKLREIEKLTAQGMTIPMTAKKVGVTDQTFYRWRLRYGALKEDEARRKSGGPLRTWYAGTRSPSVGRSGSSGSIAPPSVANRSSPGLEITACRPLLQHNPGAVNARPRRVTRQFGRCRASGARPYFIPGQR
jgi:Transposase